jgi:hypothetical protein
MEKPSRRIAVVMLRRQLQGRWPRDEWQPIGVVPDGGEQQGPRRIVAEEHAEQWLHPGLELSLRKTDADGYYLNVSTRVPKVFVLWRDEDGRGVPAYVTASYSEASSWMEAGEHVDPVPMPEDLFAWVGEFVEQHYRPQPKKRLRPQSFRHPKDRMRG